MKKTFVILFSLMFLVWYAAFAKTEAKPTMRFFLHDENNISETLGGLQKIIQLQYNYAEDKLPVDSIYEGRTNKKFENTSENQYLSSTQTYAMYQKLMFVFKYDTLYSAIFTYSGYNAAYDVNLNKENTTVKNITPWFFRDDMPFSFYRNIIVSIIVEFFALWLVLLLFRYPSKSRFLIGILIANIVSVTVFSFGIMKLMDSVIGYFIGLVFIVLFESLFLWYFTRKAGTYGRMLLLVVFLNFISLMVSGALQFFNGMFGASLMLNFI